MIAILQCISLTMSPTMSPMIAPSAANHIHVTNECKKTWKWSIRMKWLSKHFHEMQISICNHWQSNHCNIIDNNDLEQSKNRYCHIAKYNTHAICVHTSQTKTNQTMLPKQTRENHINMYMRWHWLLEAIATYLFKRKKRMEQQGKHDNHR